MINLLLKLETEKNRQERRPCRFLTLKNNIFILQRTVLAFQ